MLLGVLFDSEVCGRRFLHIAFGIIAIQNVHKKAGIYFQTFDDVGENNKSNCSLGITVLFAEYCLL
jgi:hypothetical protein